MVFFAKYIWTGSEFIVWGGRSDGLLSQLNDGVIFKP